MADRFSTNLYNRRVQLARGKAEEGNRFEIWRELYRQYAGGSHIVKFGGQLRLKDWPKCTSMAKLEVHLDGWQACLDEYGTEMYAGPNILRTMLIGTLPDELENEINEKPHLTDCQNIIDWCKVSIGQKRPQAPFANNMII